MKLKKIYVKNFLSFQEAELDLENRGLILIDGDNQSETDAIGTNGSGKSSIISAIFYALYGELPNGTGSDSVINRQAGKGTEVKLWFEQGGQEYLIHRGRKKNFVKLFQGDNELTAGTMKATMALIMTIIKMPKDLFMSAIYFDGHNSVPFSKLTDKQKKEFLESIADIDLYRKAHELSKQDLATINGQINVSRAQIEQLRSHKAYIEQQATQQAEARTEALKAIDDLKAQVGDAKKQVAIQEPLTEGILNTTTREVTDLANQEAELNNSKQQLLTVQSNLQMYNQQVASLNARINRQKEQIQQQVTLLSQVNDSEVCIVCGNPMDANHKKKEYNRIIGEIANIQQGVDKDIADLQPTSALVTQTQEQFNQLKETLNSDYVKEQLDSIALRRSQLSSEASQARTKVNTLKQQQMSLEGLLRGREEQLNSQVDYATEQTKTDDQIKTVTTDLESLVDRASKLDKAMIAFSDKGIKSHVLDLITPHLNEAINQYLGVLTGSLISVEFATQGHKANGDLTDKFDILVHNNGEEATYDSLSSGEKRRVDIAISLTIQDMIMNKADLQINTLFYDELFEALDAVGSENVVELLRTRLQKVDSIFVITHNEDLRPLFDNVITVTKKEGISTIS